MLKRWLEHPLTRGFDLDDPNLIGVRRKLARDKAFLRRLYEEWYEEIRSALPPGEEPVLELGSGPGFLNERIPRVITSDVLPSSGIDVLLNASGLPVASGALRGVVMTNVLHHLGDPRAFFREATRVVRPGGAIVMIEPWATTVSRLTYSYLHHEPFDMKAATWEFASAGPLTDANGALPWIIFERDRAVFEREFPEWRVSRIRLDMPFAYVLSGGMSLRGLVPGWAYGVCRSFERTLKPWMRHLAMFASIVLTREGGLPA